MAQTTQGLHIVIGQFGLQLAGNKDVASEFVRLLHYPDGDPNPDAAVAPALVNAPIGSLAVNLDGVWQKTAPTVWTPFATAATDTYTDVGNLINDDTEIQFDRTNATNYVVDVRPLKADSLDLVGTDLVLGFANGGNLNTNLGPLAKRQKTIAITADANFAPGALTIDLTAPPFVGIGAPDYDPVVGLRTTFLSPGPGYTLTRDGQDRVTHVTFQVAVNSSDEIVISYHPDA